MLNYDHELHVLGYTCKYRVARKKRPELSHGVMQQSKMLAHYIHAFLLIHFTYSVSLRHAKVWDVFFGPPGKLNSLKHLVRTTVATSDN